MTAPPLPIIYFLALLALFATALVIHLRATTLSLPLDALSIATVALTLVAGINSYLHSQLTSFLSGVAHVRDATTRRRRRRTLQLARTSTQTLQGLFAAVLAALLLQRVVPNAFLSCSLENAWSRMWMTHDAAGIRAIEETLKCCGFRSVKDRPWPFPRGQAPDLGTCRSRMGYSVACEGPWRAQMQNSAGGEFAIVVIVSLMQIGNILVHAGYFGRMRPWFSQAGPLLLSAGEDDEDDHENPRRPLLPSALSSDRRSGRRSFGRIVEEAEDEEDGDAEGAGGPAAIKNGGGENGGAGAGGRRVYPSGIAGGAGAVQSLPQQQQHEGNVWSQNRRGEDGDASSDSEAF